VESRQLVNASKCCEYRPHWRRGWDSNPTPPFRFCKLQIPQCRHCRRCQQRRRALPAIARWLSSPRSQSGARATLRSSAQSRFDSEAETRLKTAAPPRRLLFADHREPNVCSRGSGERQPAALLLLNSCRASRPRLSADDLRQHAADGRPAGATTAGCAIADEFLDAFPGVDFGRVDVAVRINAYLV